MIEGGGDNGARGHNPSLWRDTAIDVHRLLVPPVLTLHRWVGARDRFGSEILDDVGRSKLLMGRAVEEGDPMTQDELQSALTGSAGSGAITRHGVGWLWTASGPALSGRRGCRVTYRRSPASSRCQTRVGGNNGPVDVARLI